MLNAGDTKATGVLLASVINANGDARHLESLHVFDNGPAQFAELWILERGEGGDRIHDSHTFLRKKRFYIKRVVILEAKSGFRRPI